jgi:intein/homing endonuclease
LNKLDLSYLAGLIDGEGTITFCVQGPKPYHMSIKVSISNTSLPLLQKVKEITKTGHIGSNYIKEKPRYKQGHNWTLNGRKAQKFLKKIVSFLKLKGPQAELALQISLNYQYSEVTKEEKRLRLKLLPLMRKLNKRGI